MVIRSADGLCSTLSFSLILPPNILPHLWEAREGAGRLTGIGRV